MPAERSARVSLIVILALSAAGLLLTTLLALAPALRQLAPDLRMTAVGLGCLVIPGVLTVLLWRQRLDLDVLELVPAGFTVNLIALTALCVLAFELGLSVGLAQAAILVWGWSAFGLIVWRLRARRGPLVAVDLRSSVAVAVSVVVLVVAAGMAARIGGVLMPGQQPDRDEEAEQIALIQKISAAPRLSPTSVMYVPDALATYYYPTYHFALAMISRGAAIEPLMVFAKFRGLATVLAVLAFYAAGRALFPHRGVAFGLLAAALAMVLSGEASHSSPGFYWGLLTPYGHVADFGLGVTVLLEIFFTVRLLRGGAGVGFFMIGVPLLLLAAMTLHAREVAQILSYLAAFPIIAFVFRRTDRALLLRSLVLVGITVLIARGYGAMIAARVQHIADIETGRAALELINGRQLAAASDWLKPGQIGLLLGLVEPVPSLVLLAVPLLLAFFTRHVGVLFLCGAVLFWTTITSFEVLERFLTQASYSEIVSTPTRYVLDFGFWTVGLIVFGLTWALQLASSAIFSGESARLTPEFRAGSQATRSARFSAAFALLPTAAVVAAFVVNRTVDVPFGDFVRGVLNAITPPRTQWAVAIAGAAGVGIWVAFSRLRGRPWHGWNSLQVMAPDQTPSPLLLLVPLAVLYLVTSSHSLFDEYAQALTTPDVSDFSAWYTASPASVSLPLPIRDALLGLPWGRLVAAEGEDAQVLMTFAPHYLLNSGAKAGGVIYSTDFPFLDQWIAEQPTPPDYASHIDWAVYRQNLGDLEPSMINTIETWERYKQRSDLLREVLSTVRPIFSDSESSAQTLRYLKDWQVEYVLADTGRHSRLIQLLDSRPEFSRVVTADSRILYRVSRADI